MGSRKVHTYAASFGADLAGELIGEFTNENETVLDPFMGAGTGMFQANSLNRNAIGIDVDPIACLIVRTMRKKYRNEDIIELDEVIRQKLDKLEQVLSDSEFRDDTYVPGSEFNVNGFSCMVPNNDKILYWFAPVQRAILGGLVVIANDVKDENLGDIVRLAISSAIIRKWPNSLSLARDIDHSRPHKTARKDLSVTQQLGIFRGVWAKSVALIRKQNSIISAANISKIEVIEGDANRELDKLAIDSVDYVLTSPPYFNAIDYPRAHRYSQWWLWPEKQPLERKEYIGLKTGGKSKQNDYEIECRKILKDRIDDLKWLKELDGNKYTALCRYIMDLSEITKGVKAVLKPDKYLTFILANNRINGKEIPLSEIVKELMIMNDLEYVETKERKIEVNRRRYPYGITGFAGLLESEYIINAKKI